MTGVGTDLRGCTSFDEMMKKSNTDWKAEKIPLFTEAGEKVEDAFAIKRCSDNKILCPSVSKRYKVFNQEEFTDLADALIDLGAKPTRGDSFYGGRRVWYHFEFDDKTILGDVYKHNLYLLNSFDTTGGVIVATSMTRIVCSNAINMMLKNAANRWSYSHTGDIAGKIDEAARTILLSGNYAKAYETEAQRLLGMDVDDSFVNGFIEKIIPMPKKDEDADERIYQIQVARTELARDRIKDIYHGKEDLKDMKKSRLRLLQSVSDFVSHPEFIRERKDTKDRHEFSLMTGSPLLTKAYTLLAA